MRLRTIAMVGALILAPVIAIAQGMAPMPGMTPTTPAAPNAEANAAFMAANARMMTAMNLPLTGNTDRDFVLMMIPHHQGAIDMARVELQYGADPAIRAMAEAIIAAQTAEIAEFERWLATHP